MSAAQLRPPSRICIPADRLVAIVVERSFVRPAGRGSFARICNAVRMRVVMNLGVRKGPWQHFATATPISNIRGRHLHRSKITAVLGGSR
jgi:hypothetical protein